ncbi:PTS sugar transporter subunit IIB [Clostridioides difficile]|nr:PTS sugar transporter subunit IIB [Clostridioides difficile]
MSKKLNVLAVCGFGVGTSLILKMNVESALKSNNIDAEVSNTDITTATSCNADIIFTSNELYEQLKSTVCVPVVKIDNFMDLKEISDKGIEAINSL